MINERKNNRIDKIFKNAKDENRSALIVFIMAGDPNLEISNEVLNELPDAGADIIEIGMPFSDPSADGETIQFAANRSLKNNHTMKKTIDMVKKFRKKNVKTPIILMGYYNPILFYGVKNFLKDIKNAGVDGLIIVDLPAEEDAELCIPSIKENIDFIKLLTPTTDSNRAKKVLNNATGFIYYVSVCGITGGKKPEEKIVENNLNEIRKITKMPIVVGFGIRNSDDVKKFARFSDGVVVGSAVINKIENAFNNNENVVNETTNFVKNLAIGLKR